MNIANIANLGPLAAAAAWLYEHPMILLLK